LPVGGDHFVDRVLGFVGIGRRLHANAGDEPQIIEVAIALDLPGFVRVEQAATEGLTAEQAVRRSTFSPDPCDRGAIAAILPQLGALTIDWSKPLQDWPRETMLDFLTAAFGLIQQAMAARDSDGSGILRKSTSHTDEFNDPIGF
jgi:hypothetical protein